MLHEGPPGFPHLLWHGWPFRKTGSMSASLRGSGIGMTVPPSLSSLCGPVSSRPARFIRWHCDPFVLVRRLRLWLRWRRPPLRRLRCVELLGGRCTRSVAGSRDIPAGFSVHQSAASCGAAGASPFFLAAWLRPSLSRYWSSDFPSIKRTGRLEPGSRSSTENKRPSKISL